jgi:hypothetical protein
MDLVFIGGCLLLIMAFPAMVGAMADGSPPRGALLLILFGGALIGVAVWERPGAYSFDQIPDILMRVIGQVV